MAEITRRKLPGSSVFLPIGFGLTAAPKTLFSADALHRADTIVAGGVLLTMDPARPRAQAMAISGRHILAVGAKDSVRSLAGPNTKIVDAAGMTVTPGFIDAHSHPLLALESIGANVNLPRIEDVKKALARKAAETPSGHWVRGVMYDDTKFEDGRPLNRRDIDEAVPGHPVYVQHRGGHTAVVNSLAFEIAGITRDTPDPVGGRFYRDDGGFTGKIAEKADLPFLQSGT